MRKSSSGFTIVELLIVIVVIAILATISIVAYSGIQARSRDSQRKSDVQVIAKALELYYIDNGRYPNGSGSTTINSGWSTTADGSWSNLANALRPYIQTLPADPVSTPGISLVLSSSEGFNYAYFSNSNTGTTYCGASQNQMYLLLYRLESSDQVDTLQGDCTSSTLYYSGSSNYRVRK